MFEECGRKALTDQKEKQMSDIRSKDMDQHNRVCAQIDLDAIAYNMEHYHTEFEFVTCECKW